MSPENRVVAQTSGREPGVRRYRSLDGLRGVAATVVIGYHLLLVVPALSQTYVSGIASPFSPEWWLYKTPIRLFFAGHEAVLVFFVLSGFVLTLPLRLTAERVWTWKSYYARRLTRLYLPVWASLIFALMLAFAVARNVSAASPWIASHKPPTVVAVARDFLLLIGTSNLNSPLWSLRWEIWFSLLLPVMFYGLLLIRMQRWWILGVILLALISAFAQFPKVAEALPGAFLTVGLLQYLPVFGIGMLLALHLKEIHATANTLRCLRFPRLVWVLLVVAAILFIVSPSLLPGVPKGYDVSAAVAYLASLVGVVLVIFFASEGRPFIRFLNLRPVQWLGSRSFSIYLVHEPIVVAAALLTHADGYLPWLFVALGLIPLILLFAEGFYRFIEYPSLGLSRRLGTRFNRSIAQPRTQVTADASTDDGSPSTPK